MQASCRTSIGNRGRNILEITNEAYSADLASVVVPDGGIVFLVIAAHFVTGTVTDS
jgi:hypothetical protein